MLCVPSIFPLSSLLASVHQLDSSRSDADDVDIPTSTFRRSATLIMRDIYIFALS